MFSVSASNRKKAGVSTRFDELQRQWIGHRFGEVRGMPAPKGLVVGSLAQLLGGELVDRLEHRVARFPRELPGVDDEALVDERAEQIDGCSGNALGCRQRPAACKHGQAGEEVALVLIEQAVALTRSQHASSAVGSGDHGRPP